MVQIMNNDERHILVIFFIILTFATVGIVLALPLIWIWLNNVEMIR